MTGSSAVTLNYFPPSHSEADRRESESFPSFRPCSAGSATVSLGRILLSCEFHRPWIRLDAHCLRIAPRPTEPLSKCSQLEACPAIASRPHLLFRCPWKGGGGGGGGGGQRAKSTKHWCVNPLDYSVKYCSLYFVSCQQCSWRRSQVT